MAGLLFYWFMWGFWISAAFLMKKGQWRTALMFGILLIIMLSGVTISLPFYQLNAASMCLLVIGYGLFRCRTVSSIIYHTIVNLIIMMAYVLIHIYLLYDPALLLLVQKWMLMVVLFVIIHVLVKPFRLRLSAVLVGVCTGDILNTLVFYPYEGTIGGKENLDVVALLLVLTVAWETVHQMTFRLREVVQHQNQNRIPK